MPLIMHLQVAGSGVWAFVNDGGVEKVLLVEGKLGCSVNDAGRSLHPRHAELKEKYEETRSRLIAGGTSLQIVNELYLLVSGLYKAQIQRRMFMWNRQGLIPSVKCLCCHELLEELGVPDSRVNVDLCATPCATSACTTFSPTSTSSPNTPTASATGSGLKVLAE